MFSFIDQWKIECDIILRPITINQNQTCAVAYRFYKSLQYLIIMNHSQCVLSSGAKYSILSTVYINFTSLYFRGKCCTFTLNINLAVASY